jgi:hypothetical protein
LARQIWTFERPIMSANVTVSLLVGFESEPMKFAGKSVAFVESLPVMILQLLATAICFMSFALAQKEIKLTMNLPVGDKDR